MQAVLEPCPHGPFEDEKILGMRLSDSTCSTPRVATLGPNLSSPAQVFTVQEADNIRLETMPKTAELELQQIIL